jgi:DNA helicase-4
MNTYSVNRPYFHKLSNELAELVELHKNDPSELLKLVDEIDRRKKAADKLRQARGRALAYIQENSSNTNPISEVPNRVLEVSAQSRVSLNGMSEREVPNQISTDLHQLPNPNPQKPDDSEGYTSTPPQPEGFQIFVPASLWARVFGAKSFELSTSRSTDEITITRVDGDTVILKRDRRWRLTVGWFVGSLNITQDSKPDLKLCFGRSHAKRVALYLYRWEFGDRVLVATKQFESMVAAPAYLNSLALRNWQTTYKDLLLAAPDFPAGDELLSSFSLFATTHVELVRNRNKKFIDTEILRWRDYFNRVEKNPLTERQAEAIVSDEDYCLAIAGAGTGKTSTVVGKIGYLIEAGICPREKILALAFARDAASELRERIKERLGLEIEVRTFHSLGLEILRDLRGIKLKIADTAKGDREFLALIARLLRSVSRNEPGRTLLFDFVSKHRVPAKYLEDFSTSGQYFEYLRKVEPYTLKGELVKSFEELLIADWLCLNGIAYEYERPYEVKTASMSRHQYRPDFYLPGYGIYIEHFGINRQGKTAPGIDAAAYNKSIEWKRQLHSTHGTKLIETFSWERMEGSLTELLSKKLSAYGVVICPHDPDSIHELMETAGLNKKLVSLLKDFLVVYKENQYSVSELRLAEGGFSPGEVNRISCFLDLFELVEAEYSKHLLEREELDFADLISEATKALETGSAKLSFQRVIVDEYQDISRGRFRFLGAILRSQQDVRLLSVGDDWQSIYGFTGSDVKKTTDFQNIFDGAINVALDRTFRFNNEIQNLSARFITRNPGQLQKVISASQPLVTDPIVMIDRSASDGLEPLDRALLEIENRRLPRARWSVFILGRYKFIEPKNILEITSKYPNLDVEFRTIHSSKGLEADAVVVMDVVGGRYGFPSKIESDPIMGLVIPGEGDYEDAEERRVLYVAMTRARHCLVFVGDRTNPSPFWREICDYLGSTVSRSSGSTFSCPECGEGELLHKFPKKSKGYAWECSLAPYCSCVAKTCATCSASPFVRGRCANSKCDHPSSLKG